MTLLGALILSLQLAAGVPAQAQPAIASSAPSVEAEAAFTRMKGLAGVWRPADNPNSSLRVRFFLTAGGTVLVESWEARGRPHSMTLYHRDGARLLATHYCPQGNQPRLVLKGQDANGFHFAFADATDLDPQRESYQHDLWIDPARSDRLVRSEIYAGKSGVGSVEKTAFVRLTGE